MISKVIGPQYYWKVGLVSGCVPGTPSQQCGWVAQSGCRADPQQQCNTICSDFFWCKVGPVSSPRLITVTQVCTR